MPNQPAGSGIGPSYIIHRCSLLSSRTAPSARRCLTLRATRPAHCIAGPLARAPAVLPLASSYPSSHPFSEMPAARHTTCCLARRRLQHRVFMASEVFSSLVPSNSQLHLSAARSPRDHRDTGFPFLLQAFPSIARLTPNKGLQARELMKLCHLYWTTAAGVFR